MPPKRKSSITATIVPRKIKIQKKKAVRTQAAQDAEKAHLDIELRLKWFDKYADADTPSEIPPDRCQSFFSDLDISLESAIPIIMGWKMGAGRMGYITRDEWMDVMRSANSTNEKEFKNALLAWEAQLTTDPSQFKQLYLFSFSYVKSIGQKSMEVEAAIALWNILLEPKYPIIKTFIQFIQESKPVKVINKDQWSSLLDFCITASENLEDYDSNSSWPVLFDDYVEWRKSL